MWDLLRKINRGNLTIILTTHYMEEAETLCDRIAIIDQGILDVVDTPQNLIDELGGFCIDEPENGITVSKYFKNRVDAISYLSGRGDYANLRNTRLEDAFVERLKARK